MLPYPNKTISCVKRTIYPYKNHNIWGYIYISQDFCRTRSTLMCSTPTTTLKIESEVSEHASVAFGKNQVKSRLERKSADSKNSRKSPKKRSQLPRSPVKSTKNDNLPKKLNKTIKMMVYWREKQSK